ncbi:uncharacterized protein LAESUDRAFT_661324 [Laetiporus sulphureus 93-53]|uniref:Uncharacterized protein n=1 Tax=Laetiporus sulphureus 93-53 TaxID=1314785 RepID=A0A165CE88_9APHY|nr:uncharacterized protein LAESUDRAFT_661324 [Laetiporus sulphureus 93-53]KZT02654.1 hypothetical protein LAESUDRAFT_661324 [Laetiporus sulphureus 93-53]
MSAPHMNRPLNYFQQSPVRGQLEHPDGYSKTGWRYLQCTDTPNELRVLLPPKTATIYGHLLQAELDELDKGRDASWDNILQIRHLKDRIIRKCQRLAQASRSTGSASVKSSARSVFYTVHAPPDFRLKEMERWFKAQGGESGVNRDSAPAHDRPAASCSCEQCNPSKPVRQGGGHQMRRPSTGARSRPTGPSAVERVQMRRAQSESQSTTLLDPSIAPKKPQYRRAYSDAYKTAGLMARQFPQPHQATQPRQKPVGRKKSVSADVASEPHSNRLKPNSPEPIPIPYRARNTEADATAMADSPQSTLPALDEFSPVALPKEPTVPSSPNGQVLSPIFEGSEGREAAEVSQRAIPRRRSSFKRANSLNRLSVASQTKSVAWAMDRDWIEQMESYMKAASEAEDLGLGLDALRAGYQKEVEAMRRLCRNVVDASERIRQEMEKLQRDEEAVRRQETKLLHAFEQLERKESLFRDRVLSVLEETKCVVHLCDKKREMHEI